MITQGHRPHYWIIEVNANPKIWSWIEHATSRGGLDMQAYRSKREALADLYNAKAIYGHARLVKFTRDHN